MSYNINFESSRVKEKAREETRKGRETILEKAKADCDRKKEHDKHTDKKWMLPSVEARLDSESKSKKHKKTKKKKKKKKSHKSHKSESDNESSEEEWTEITTDQSPPSQVTKRRAPEEPVVRDEWMSLPGLFPCVTKEKKQPEKRKDQDKMMLDTMGQSERELNPYWKGGGTGLPSEEKFEKKMKNTSMSAGTVGDRGADWLRRALTRAKEQAADEGRSLEAVAAERWGSLEKLETLLAEAEARSSRGPVNQGRYPDRRNYEPQEYDKYRRDKRETGRTFREPREDGHTERSHNERWGDGDCKRGRPEREEKMYGDLSNRSKPSRRSGNEEKAERKWDRKDKNVFNDDYKGERPKEEESGFRKSRTFRQPGADEGGEGNSDDGHRYNERRGDTKSTSRSSTFQKPRGDDIHTSSFKRPTDEDSQRSVRDFRSGSSRRANWRKKESVETKQEVPKRSNSSSSSSSGGSDREREDSVTREREDSVTQEIPVALSEREMNDLGAKLIKAELLGNEALAKELKKKLDQANAVRSSAPAGSLPGSSDGRSEKEVVILTRTDSKGFTRPVSAATEPAGGRRRKQKMPTHDKEGKRVRYFADDDRLSLQEMFQNEKLNTVEDSNEMFATLAGKVKPNDDMADLFEEKVSQQMSAGKQEARERSHAIGEFKRSEKALDSCKHCFDSKLMLKHLVIAIGTKVYLSLPPYQSLTEGHCLITPIHHVPCATQLDEDVWAEVQSFRRALTAMFVKMDEDVVYIETAMRLRKYPHMVLECVPMPTETGHLAPIYFKKAILECETEWSTNRKLVDTMGRDVRRAIPKGLPYFSVDFGNGGGFAHVVEDESQFPNNFAQEIVGGMLDLDHNLWRKPQRENFDAQRKKVLQFAEWWKPFDFTSKARDTDSDSD